MTRTLRRPSLYGALVLASMLFSAAAVILFAQPGRAATDDAPARGGVHAITVDEPEIRRLLTESGWVSPGLSAKKWVYMVSFRSCGDCIRFETEEFPALHKAGVDTRVIMVARRARSTAPERSGVAELWAKRSWETFETWTGMPVTAWTAQGLPSGDDDPARAALVEKGRALTERLEPLLAENGIQFAYPTLIWEGPDGHLRGCACEARETYPQIRRELGIPVG